MGEIAAWTAVAGVTLVVVAAALGLRYLRTTRSRSLPGADLEPGVYLFTSLDCSTCVRARRKLAATKVAFREITWQEEEDAFERLGIDAVPSVVVVDREGSARWYRGGVPARLEFPGSRRGTG